MSEPESASLPLFHCQSMAMAMGAFSRGVGFFLTLLGQESCSSLLLPEGPRRSHRSPGRPTLNLCVWRVRFIGSHHPGNIFSLPLDMQTSWLERRWRHWHSGQRAASG